MKKMCSLLCICFFLMGCSEDNVQTEDLNSTIESQMSNYTPTTKYKEGIGKKPDQMIWIDDMLFISYQQMDSEKEVVEDGKIITRYQSEISIGQKYMALPNIIKRIDTDSSGNEITTIDKYELNIYQITNDIQEFDHTVDVKKIWTESDINEEALIGRSIINVNGKEMLYLYSMSGADVLYDIETKEVSDSNYQDDGTFLLYDKFINNTNYPSKAALSINFNTKSSTVFLTLRDPDMDLEDIQLFKKHPELIELMKDESYIYTGVLVFHPDEQRREEILSDALMEGQSVYDGLLLDGMYTTDGETHEIHSMEEFKQWYKIEE